MVSFSNALTDFMRSNLCTALGVLGPAVTLGQKLSPIGFPPVNVPNALSMLLCDEPPNRLPPPEPPFTGGQCVGRNYTVTIRSEVYPFSDCSTFGPSNSVIGFAGPIRGLVTRTENPSGDLCTPGGNAIYLQHGPNTNSETLVAAGGYGATASILSVVPEDGLPDECGDPPPILPPPGDVYEFGDDITYNIDESTEITVPVTAIFSPIFVDLDGSLKIPVNIDVGGVTFKGELEIAPKFELNIKPTNITTGPGQPDDDDPSGGQPQVPVPEDEEDVDVIVGVLVYSQFDGDENGATGFPSVGGPNFLVPRIGSVQFAIKTGNSIGWTSDLDVKNLECYVPCPAPQGAIAVRVTPSVGFTRTFTPVRGKPLTSF